MGVLANDVNAWWPGRSSVSNNAETVLGQIGFAWEFGISDFVFEQSNSAQMEDHLFTLYLSVVD